MSDALNYTRASKIRRFGPLATTSGNRAGNGSSAQDGLRSPLLPNDIQRSLLHVGMRVRKSVPEGYKTGADDFGRALRERTSGIHESFEKTKKNQYANAKKRIFAEEPEPTASPTWRSDLTIQTVLNFGTAPRQLSFSKTRSFAIPKSRKARPWPEQMDIDTQMFIDENGNFKDADFLDFKNS